MSEETVEAAPEGGPTGADRPESADADLGAVVVQPGVESPPGSPAGRPEAAGRGHEACFAVNGLDGQVRTSDPGSVAARDLFESRTADRLSASRYDALLRELLTFGLVEASLDGGRRSWRLTPGAVARLDHLRPPSVEPGRTMHFGRRCDSCYEPTVTRLVGERYLCAACLAELEAADQPGRSTPEAADASDAKRVMAERGSPALSPGPIAGAA